METERRKVLGTATVDETIEEKFTEEDLDNCWIYYKSYLIDILNGDYDLQVAREDLKGLIGSKFDKRLSNMKNIL